MASFFGGLASSMGSMVQAGRIEAETEQRKAHANMLNMEAMAMKTKQANQKALGAYIAAEQGADKQAVRDPAEAAQMYGKAENFALQSGDFAGAEQMSKLAKGKIEQSNMAATAVAKKIQASKEQLSESASEFMTSPSAEAAGTLARSAVAAGVNPVSIPPPGTPDFMSWAHAQTLASMNGKEKATFVEKVQDTQERRQDRLSAHADSMAIHAESVRSRAMLQAGMQEDRQERRKAAEGRASFGQGEKLNSSLQREAKPFLEDRRNVDSLEDLLQVNSSAADQQIRQNLTSLLGHFKGRATNLFYKDNKNFGDVVDRVTGLVSHAFSGRYSEENRAQIYDLLQGLKTMSIDPALAKLEQGQKNHAAKYGIDPELIEIQGDFLRKGETSSDKRPDFLPKGETTPSVKPVTATIAKPGEERVVNGVTYVMGADGRPYKKVGQ